MFNRKRLINWLHFRFPNREFTEANVNRCFNIFSILLDRYDNIYHTKIVEVGYDKEFVNYGILINKRKNILKHLLNAENLIIKCSPGFGGGENYCIYSELNDMVQKLSLKFSEILEIKKIGFESNNEKDASFMKFFAKLKSSKRYKVSLDQIFDQKNSFLSFTLMELLEDDWAYSKFLNYWNSIPTYQDLKNVLQKKFPKDIVNHIFTFLTSQRLREVRRLYIG